MPSHSPILSQALLSSISPLILLCRPLSQAMFLFLPLFSFWLITPSPTLFIFMSSDSFTSFHALPSSRFSPILFFRLVSPAMLLLFPITFFPLVYHFLFHLVLSSSHAFFPSHSRFLSPSLLFHLCTQPLPYLSHFFALSICIGLSLLPRRARLPVTEAATVVHVDQGVRSVLRGALGRSYSRGDANGTKLQRGGVWGAGTDCRTTHLPVRPR